MRVAILGRTQFLYNTIPLLEQAGHEIVIIGTCKASEEYTVNERDFEETAIEKKIPFFCTSKINDKAIEEKLRDVNADIAISMNWISMIGKSIIDCFPYGVLNAHAGDLPRYRGNACPNWAIINGEKKIGLSIHFMDADRLDAGNIVIKKYISIDNNTTIGYIYEQLETIIPNAYLESLNIIGSGKMGIVQEGNVLRCYPRKPSDGRIDWFKSIYEIDKLVRASGYPFAGAYTYFQNYKIIINTIQIEEFTYNILAVPGQVVGLDKKEGILSIAAKDGVVKIIDGYIEEKKDKKLTDVVSSMRDRLGYVCEDEIYQLKEEIQQLHKMLKNKKSW